MKSLICLFAAAVFAVIVNAETTEVELASDTLAPVTVTKNIRKLSDSASAVVKVTCGLLPLKKSENFAFSAAAFLKAARADSLKNTDTAVVDPKDYGLSFYKLTPESLMSTRSNSFWAGKLNPTTPFQQECGQVNWILIEAQSSSGGNNISMDMMEFETKSSDSGTSTNLGLLGKKLTLSGSYGPLAPGYLADGTPVTSGPISQKVQSFQVLICPPCFDVCDTEDGIKLVRNWLNQFMAMDGKFTVKYTAKVGSSVSTALLSTEGLASVPMLHIGAHHGDHHVALHIGNAEPSRSYRLLFKPNLGAAWSLQAVILGTDMFEVPIGSQPYGFYRVVAQ